MSLLKRTHKLISTHHGLYTFFLPCAWTVCTDCIYTILSLQIDYALDYVIRRVMNSNLILIDYNIVSNIFHVTSLSRLWSKY